MKLTRQHKIKLLSFFPKLELSYIKNIHKKVLSDIYLTIPKGYKFFAWFKCWNKQNICFLMKIDSKTKKILDINIHSCVFDYSLCMGNGTILYGTMIKNKTNIFNIEDIFYYKNKNINNVNFNNKLTYLEKFCKNDISNKCYQKDDVMFGLPLMNYDFDLLLRQIENIPYPVYCIQHRNLFKKRAHLNLKINNLISKVEYFSVSACIEEDLYLLHCMDNNTLVEHNYAYISDYKTSVFMNSIFRNIVENNDLDKLEESDDEEEFENVNLDKFINDKIIIMKCAFVQKFNLWKPIEISTNKLSERRTVLNCEKNNRV
jgi:hypothetical protein